MTDPYTILRAFVAAYSGDPIADSDLDDEQPRTITVTLGDIRRAERVMNGPQDHALDPDTLRKLSRTEMIRVLDEFRSARDAAERSAMRAFDERNVALKQLAAAQERT